MTSQDDLLNVLQGFGFQTGSGPVSPFGQPLPLVTGWAVDELTAIVVLLVEDPERGKNSDTWRELLFAVSGLRHELRHGRAAAFGAPILLALLRDEEEGQRLRALVEDLTRKYLLFSRVELNAVMLFESNLDLHRALAPLLPRCREAIREGVVLSRELLGSLAPATSRGDFVPM